MMSVNDSEQKQCEPEQVFSQPVRPLTRQELHVLEFLGQGYTNEDIAHALDIAVSTVSSHVQHILKKLQVRNRVEAVLYMKYRAGVAGGRISPQLLIGPKKQVTASDGRSLSLYDPLLFLSQLNHVNWYIAMYGPVHIDYFGMIGDVWMVFYDPCACQLNVHMALYGMYSEKVNVEIDEILWKYILEIVEVVAKNPTFSHAASQASSPFVSDAQKIGVSE
jgi:DNA-binding CsgD family transcriptional regulator